MFKSLKILFIYFLFNTMHINAQTSITYNDIKNMTNASYDEAITMFKNKGFSFDSVTEDEVVYSKENKAYFLAKSLHDGAITFTLFGDNLEKIFSNIKNMAKSTGYIEGIPSLNKENNSFCVSYHNPPNNILVFCESKIAYSPTDEELFFSIQSFKNNYE